MLEILGLQEDHLMEVLDNEWSPESPQISCGGEVTFSPDDPVLLAVG